MKNRLGYVDGLRAIAVLSVTLFHARVHLVGAAHLEPWFKECAHGVDLFFVLSGFCLSYPTLERLRASETIRFDAVAYALKRALRILPPYAIAVVLGAVAAAALGAAGIALPAGLHALDLAGIAQNLAFLDKPHEYVNSSFWSLGIEFRWYFIFPFALVLAARNLRAFVAATLAIAVAAEFTAASSIDLGCLSAFLLGIVAAVVRLHGSRLTRYALPLGLVCAFAGLANEARPHFPIQTNTGWHAAAFFFVIAAGAWAPLERVLALRALGWVGIASYSIYLVHEPIVSFVVVALAPRIGEAGAMAAAIAAGVTAGCTMWAVFERPLTRPAFVRDAVAGGRARALELFELAGIPADVTIRRGRTVAPRVAVPLVQEAV